MSPFFAFELAFVLIMLVIYGYLAGKYSKEIKQLKEENNRLKKELLQQVNENLKLKNNISTDTV